MESQTNIPILIALGCLVMFAMVMVIILFVVRHQRKMFEHRMLLQAVENEKQVALIKASLEAEERQKTIIANNLHDSIKPMLTHLKYSLTAHQSAILDNRFSFKDLDKDREAIDKISNEIRNTCHDLIPSVLNMHGLKKALEEFIEALNNSGLVMAGFTNGLAESDWEHFPKSSQVNIYRVCQELLNNILKHSGCSQISLSVFLNNNKLCIEMNYNGVGITDADVEKLSISGLGLNSLKTRVLILNADLNYLKNGSVYAVKFHIPLNNGQKN